MEVPQQKVGREPKVQRKRTEIETISGICSHHFVKLENTPKLTLLTCTHTDLTRNVVSSPTINLNAQKSISVPLLQPVIFTNTTFWLPIPICYYWIFASRGWMKNLSRNRQQNKRDWISNQTHQRNFSPLSFKRLGGTQIFENPKTKLKQFLVSSHSNYWNSLTLKLAS